MNLDATLEELRARHRATARYSVVCSKRNREDRVICKGLVWDEARGIADKLQTLHDSVRPRLTSWTKRLYFVEMEQNERRETMSYEQHQCLRCGYTWHARWLWSNHGKEQPPPKRCAKCRSPLWNKPFERYGWRERAEARGVPVQDILTRRSQSEKDTAVAAVATSKRTKRRQTSHRGRRRR